MGQITNQLLADVQYRIIGGGIDPGNNPGESTAIAEKIIGNVIGIITIVAILYFSFQLIFAGYAFLTTEGDKNKMEAARKRITEGILGLVLVVIALGIGALLSTLLGIDNALNLEQLFVKMGL